MSVIRVDIQLTPQDLMAAAEQLKTEELDRFVDTMLALKARRHTPVLSLEETELLTKINQGLDAATQDWYAELISKRQDERISASEHEELLQIIRQVEALNVQRLTYLTELAALRQTSLTQLMSDLGLDTPAYV